MPPGQPLKVPPQRRPRRKPRPPDRRHKPRRSPTRCKRRFKRRSPTCSQTGESVSEIVQQLAAALASSLAAQFGGDPAQIQNQLQTAFVSALSPPSTGPPLSNTDLASALAQRFRQVADVAAGVLGETGQSNRLFAGSISDAATTAGVQPAPQPSDTTPAPADSMATDASALLASLTASQGDGKTVATNGAPALGSNGDTLLGRMLARAAQSQLATGPQAPAPAPPAPSGPSSLLTVFALAAATAALGNGSATPSPAPNPVATDASAAVIQRVVAESASVPNSGSADPAISTQAPAPLSPAVLAFVKSFTDALASTSAPATDKPATSTGPDTGTLLSTDVSSAQAPTIGAFAPVQAPVQNDALSANGPQTPAPALPSPTTVDPKCSRRSTRPRLVSEYGRHHVYRAHATRSGKPRRRQRQAHHRRQLGFRASHGADPGRTRCARRGTRHSSTRSLADAGLKLTSFNVDLAGGFASFQQQQQQQSSQQGQSNGRALLLGGVDTTETDDSQLAAAPNFGPPVLAGSSWSALNYLV